MNTAQNYTDVEPEASAPAQIVLARLTSGLSVNIEHFEQECPVPDMAKEYVLRELDRMVDMYLAAQPEGREKTDLQEHMHALLHGSVNLAWTTYQQAQVLYS